MPVTPAYAISAGGASQSGGLSSSGEGVKSHPKLAGRPNAEWRPWQASLGGVAVFARLPRSYFRWAAISCLALLVFVLGYAGFREYYRAARRERSVADITYVTLQLFVLQSGDLERPIGWKLDFARFAAPVVAAYAGFCALLSLFFFPRLLFRPRLMGGHVIVCGLGRRGSKLVQQLRAAGKCVVVIEEDENNTEVAHCRQMGAIARSGRPTTAAFWKGRASTAPRA